MPTVRIAVAVLLAASSARAFADEPCGYGGGSIDPPPEVACDAAEIDMERACHCRGDGREERHPWGSTAGLTLEMPRTARVASGQTVTLPFTLLYKGDKPITLDFPGGAVVYVDDVRHGGKEAPSAPCGELTVLPPNVRLTLRAGAKVRGTMSWRASTSQLWSCRDLARDLPAGRYAVRFATVSGDPPLKVTVEVTVVKGR